MEPTAARRHAGERRRIEEILRSAPPSIRMANNYLLLAAIFIIGERTYMAWARDVAMWRGFVMGGFCAMLAFRGGLAIYNKKRFAYWAVIVGATLVLAREALHLFAEATRFFGVAAEIHPSLVLAAIYCLLAVAILRSLLRRDSRAYLQSPAIETNVEVIDEHAQPGAPIADQGAIPGSQTP